MNQYFVYLYRIKGAPAYVGKGLGKREESHVAFARCLARGAGPNYPLHFDLVLAKAIRKGMPFTCERIAEGLDEAAAFALEIELIARYGRKGIEPKGILYNRQSGGRGNSDDGKRATAHLWRREVAA